MVRNKKKLNDAIQKELLFVAKVEAKLQKCAEADAPKYKDVLKSKIPKGLNQTLEKSFSKALGIVFKNGVGIIEKCYAKENLSQDFNIADYSINLKCSSKELKSLRKKAKRSDLKNMSIATVEGIGLGVLGIGLPDIVLFIGMVLKGIYEVSLSYGYSYDLPAEKNLILKLIGASLSKSDDWKSRNKEINSILNAPPVADEDMIKTQIEDTAKQLAVDMLALKFIQGFPIVGIFGGACNPIYYNKIMRYVRIKYYKRYLNDKLCEVEQHQINKMMLQRCFRYRR